MEIRILPDGRVAFLAPDEDLMAVAEALNPDYANANKRKEGDHGRDRPGETRRSDT